MELGDPMGALLSCGYDTTTQRIRPAETLSTDLLGQAVAVETL